LIRYYYYSLSSRGITEEDEQGLALLFSEFELVLNELKNRKSERPGGLPGDLRKALGSKGKQELFEICSQIYERVLGIRNNSNRKEMWCT